MTLLTRFTFLAAAALCVLVAEACSATPARPRGPEPVYEPPRLGPWDAGAGESGADPYAAAAESEWLDENQDGGRAEAGVGDEAGSDGAVSLDAAHAMDLH